MTTDNNNPTPQAAAPADTAAAEQRELERVQRMTTKLAREIQRCPTPEYAAVFQGTVLGALIAAVTDEQFDAILLDCGLRLEMNVQAMRAAAAGQQVRSGLITNA